MSAHFLKIGICLPKAAGSVRHFCVALSSLDNVNKECVILGGVGIGVRVAMRRLHKLSAIVGLFIAGLLLAPLGSFDVRAATSQASAGYADKVVVLKRERVLQLWRDGEVMRSFNVALGRSPNGAKQFEGDGRTPEGRYFLQGWNPASRFYKAINISYPNPGDRRRAAAAGKAPGGAIMIHGLPAELAHWGSDHYLFNWTEGCIALTNEEMDIVWNSVRPGTLIEIMP